MKNTADVTGGKPIAVLLQSISDVSAINPLVVFYDIHGGKREVLFFYFVPDTTRDHLCKYVVLLVRCKNRGGFFNDVLGTCFWTWKFLRSRFDDALLTIVKCYA
jgi:hypothetical protein